jgi:hypothetical protein
MATGTVKMIPPVGFEAKTSHIASGAVREVEGHAQGSPPSSFVPRRPPSPSWAASGTARVLAQSSWVHTRS